MSYDQANRMTAATVMGHGTEYYGYAPDNKRVYRMKADGTEELTLYGVRGEKLATFRLYDGATPMPTWAGVWFGGRLLNQQQILRNPGLSARDRLGSVRATGSNPLQGTPAMVARFYPYGDEVGAATARDGAEFATYRRDGFSGFDYADQRMYASGYGRFNTVDPKLASGRSGNPGSWNRYAYVGGDPIKFSDPHGLERMDCGPDWIGDASVLGPCCLPGDVPDPACYAGGGGSSGGGDGGGGGGGEDFLGRDESDALRDLGTKQKCWELLGFASGQAAQSWFTNSITFKYVEDGFLRLQGGAPAALPAPAQTSTFGTVYINTDYNWADFSKVTTSTGSKYDYLAYINRSLQTNMNSEQLGTLIIIHELQHNRPGGPDKESPAEKLAIYNQCVK